MTSTGHKNSDYNNNIGPNPQEPVIYDWSMISNRELFKKAEQVYEGVQTFLELE